MQLESINTSVKPQTSASQHCNTAKEYQWKLEVVCNWRNRRNIGGLKEGRKSLGRRYVSALVQTVPCQPHKRIGKMPALGALWILSPGECWQQRGNYRQKSHAGELMRWFPGSRADTFLLPDLSNESDRAKRTQMLPKRRRMMLWVFWVKLLAWLLLASTSV